jgi:hypothetical protein
MDNLRRQIARLYKATNSDDWWDREVAGFALRDLTEDHFGDVMKLTKEWASDASSRIRRAACLACLQRKRKTSSDRLPIILRRLSVLMKDDDIYVRKCCGPYVVAYLAYTYPTLVLPWLRKQASSPNMNARANAAKAFSQSLGGRLPAVGVSILRLLARDNNRRVRQAVLASARNIARRSEAGRSLVERKLSPLLQ